MTKPSSSSATQPLSPCSQRPVAKSRRRIRVLMLDAAIAAFGSTAVLAYEVFSVMPSVGLNLLLYGYSLALMMIGVRNLTRAGDTRRNAYRGISCTL